VRIALYIIAGWITLGCLYAIGTIGKPRKPTEGSAAAIIVVIDAAIVTTLVLAAAKLPLPGKPQDATGTRRSEGECNSRGQKSRSAGHSSCPHAF